MKLVLASASPRRAELLALAGFHFEVRPTQIDESRLPDESPADYALRLSAEKAQAVASTLDAPALILAADTIVVDGDAVLGKPRDAAHATAILRRLRGREHRVYTALTLLDAATGRQISDLAASPVRMRAYTDAEIAAYVASGAPFDKAGAYGIQNHGFHPVKEFSHCYANVMGLPLCHVARVLRRLGIEPPADVPVACQASIQYTCPVTAAILNRQD